MAAVGKWGMQTWRCAGLDCCSSEAQSTATNPHAAALTQTPGACSLAHELSRPSHPRPIAAPSQPAPPHVGFGTGPACRPSCSQGGACSCPGGGPRGSPWPAQGPAGGDGGRHDGGVARQQGQAAAAGGREERSTPCVGARGEGGGGGGELQQPEALAFGKWWQLWWACAACWQLCSVCMSSEGLRHAFICRVCAGWRHGKQQGQGASQPAASSWRMTLRP